MFNYIFAITYKNNIFNTSRTYEFIKTQLMFSVLQTQLRRLFDCIFVLVIFLYLFVVSFLLHILVSSILLIQTRFLVVDDDIFLTIASVKKKCRFLFCNLRETLV